MENRIHARLTMIAYFKILFERSNMEWTSDHSGEIGELVDRLINAAKEEILIEQKRNGGKNLNGGRKF